MRRINALPRLAAVLCGCVHESPLGGSPSPEPNPALAAAVRANTAPGPMAGQPTDPAVIGDLLFLREEEKLARDVHITRH